MRTGRRDSWTDFPNLASGRGPAGDDPTALTGDLAGVARMFAGQEPVKVMLDKIVHLAVKHLDGCDHAGISLIERRRITSPASTGDLPRAVGRIQEVVGEGPCLDAIRARAVVQTDDLAAEERWPEFSTRAHRATGVCTILSLHLDVDQDTRGALNLYSTEHGAFDDSDLARPSVFAGHVAAALRWARGAHQLGSKLVAVSSSETRTAC